MLISTLFTNPIEFVLLAVCLLLSLTVHEFAHAYASNKLGDPTAKMLGRLTLNPIKHLDPFGTLMMLLVGFGWGKPVPVNDYNLKNPRRDSAIIAFAGPLSNIILASICAILYHAFFANNILGSLLNLLAYFNLALCFFNLFPVFPLDGFKVVSGLLPHETSLKWEETERYGVYILAILFFTGFTSRLLSPLIGVSMKLLGLGL